MLFRKSSSQAEPAGGSVAPDVKVPEMSDALRNAVERVHAATRQLEMIEAAINSTRLSMESGRAELERARDRLANAEATAALDASDGNKGEDKALRRSYLALRDGLELSAVRLSGLEARKREAEAAVREAKRGLVAAWSTWQAEQISLLEATYSQSANRFLDECGVTLRALAAMSAPGSVRLSVCLHDLKVPTLGDSWKDQANPARLRRREVAGADAQCAQLRATANRILPLLAGYVDAPAAPVPVATSERPDQAVPAPEGNDAAA